MRLPLESLTVDGVPILFDAGDVTVGVSGGMRVWAIVVDGASPQRFHAGELAIVARTDDGRTLTGHVYVIAAPIRHGFTLSMVGTGVLRGLEPIDQSRFDQLNRPIGQPLGCRIANA